MYATLTPQSFRPSDVLIRLLYTGINVPIQAQQHMLFCTMEQIRFRFTEAVNNIRERRVFLHDDTDDFVVVDENYNVHSEFFEQIRKYANFHPAAVHDDIYFQLRLGEEIVSWFLKQPNEARKMGMERKGKKLILVRKPKPKAQRADIDISGCA